MPQNSEDILSLALRSDAQDFDITLCNDQILSAAPLGRKNML